MFFVLSDSSLVGIYLGVIREDCDDGPAAGPRSSYLGPCTQCT